MWDKKFPTIKTHIEVRKQESTTMCWFILSILLFLGPFIN